ncbi:MAG: glycyl-radical enzyme activating protein [Clostridia bacterium]|nr:glycyl-radical enzyme activating protein [Clostridia bacterium]
MTGRSDRAAVPDCAPECRGTIFELKRFAVHDGPGLRSTLFLKGCPLRCPWCQNPEGLSAGIRLWHRPRSCVRCGRCIAACRSGALTLSDRVHIDRSACTRCGRCIEACPVGALSLDGRVVSPGEAADMLLEDRVFFQDGGGVTLSGGEVFVQWPFALEVLKRCKAEGVDTAIESSMYTSADVLERFLPLVDHFIMDIKYMDAETHRRVLGVDNRQILENHARLVAAGADVLVRTPLIPGYTATEENVRAIASYLASVDPDAKVELLNFNPMCRSKYAALEWEYPVDGRALTAEEMAAFHRILEAEGLRNIIRE